MNASPLQRNAFWLYGVIVGLAIQQSISSVVPPLFRPGEELIVIPAAAGAWKLIVFLLMVIRFYLGSALFFSEAERKSGGPMLGAGVGDFLFGVFHFLVFFSWSVTLNVEKLFGIFTVFEIFLSATLLWDLVWWLFTRTSDSADRKRYWALINVFTLILVILFHLAFYFGFDNVSLAESFALLPVVFFSIVDMKGMADRKEYFAQFLNNLTGFLPSDRNSARKAQTRENEEQ